MSTPMSSLTAIRQIVSVCQAVTGRSLGGEIGGTRMSVSSFHNEHLGYGICILVTPQWF